MKEKKEVGVLYCEHYVIDLLKASIVSLKNDIIALDQIKRKWLVS